jgi:hypothetical protein
MKTFALIAASFGLAVALHAGETAAQKVEELLAKGNHTDLGPTPAAVSSNEAQRLRGCLKSPGSYQPGA